MSLKNALKLHNYDDLASREVAFLPLSPVRDPIIPQMTLYPGNIPTLDMQIKRRTLNGLLYGR